MSNKFYVYIHRRKSDGRIFYVGKGSGTRAGMGTGRNNYWNRIARKHGWVWEKPYQNLTEACAHSIERMIIFAIGKKNLANFCDGGEGFVGGSHSQESREKIGKTCSQWRLSNPEAMKIAAIKSSQTKKANGTYEKFSALMREKYKDIEYRRKVAIANGGKLIKLSHPYHGIHELFPFEWKERFGLNSTGVRTVVRGKYKQHKGWTLP